mmetsp:Transcript_11927/g.18984  ORF Transcript_11927/g.18984 Transcript_11927/m.18984 type:complete len:114 (+) Transcript_11927:156-497(+)
MKLTGVIFAIAMLVATQAASLRETNDSMITVPTSNGINDMPCPDAKKMSTIITYLTSRDKATKKSGCASFHNFRFCMKSCLVLYAAGFCHEVGLSQAACGLPLSRLYTLICKR